MNKIDTIGFNSCFEFLNANQNAHLRKMRPYICLFGDRHPCVGCQGLPGFTFEGPPGVNFQKVEGMRNIEDNISFGHYLYRYKKLSFYCVHVSTALYVFTTSSFILTNIP